MNGRVLVAMSGGVDSSVAALLLGRAGYEVVGATLNLWSYEGREEPYNGCCSLEVRAVAQQLAIEHHFVDEGEAFKAQVVDPFVQDSLGDLTPLPCARCNRLVRIPKLLELADRLDCDLLATGHHARVRRENGRFTLLVGRDPTKDQSYFLYMLGQEELNRLLFPVGERTKEEVRRIACRYNLAAARKPESQDLCFLPGGDVRGFLRERGNGTHRPGEIVDLEGHVLGEHQGLAFYTIGQRRGLGVSAGERVYVVAVDRAKNLLIVGPEEALYSMSLVAEEAHFVRPEEPKGELRAEVKIRYRSRPAPATLEPLGEDRVLVRFDQAQRAITPGQVAVFYRGDRVLGGGTIARTGVPAELNAR